MFKLHKFFEVFLSMLFGFALVASTFSKLRIPSLPIGFGEAAMTIWLALQAFTLLGYRQCAISHRSGKIILGIFVIYSSILIGGFFNQSFLQIDNIGIFDNGDFYRNLIAMSFVVAIIAVMLIDKSNIKIRMRGISLSVWIYFFVILSMSRFSEFVMYDDIRLSGFSDNPNQLALVVILGLAVFSNSLTRNGNKFFNLLGIMMSIIVGYLCESDALKIAISAILPIILSYVFIASGNNIRVKVFKFMIVFIVSLSIGFLLKDKLFIIIDHMSSDQGNQGEGRTTLWKHGIEAWTLSPVFGLGGGAFSGILGPFEHTESHNTYIDILTNGGIVSLVSMLYIVINALKTGFERNYYILSFSIVSISIFIMFHHVFRQPIFWTVIIMPMLQDFTLVKLGMVNTMGHRSK